MHKKINEWLLSLEHEKRIKIIFAVEAGSRIWGFESEDSDYDIRFIYARPLVDYLAINACTTKDSIVFAHGNLDFAGWDLRKALGLYRKSNPAIMEWLSSPIAYIDEHDLANRLFRWRKEQGYWSERASQYHYYHMAQNNWRRYLESSTVINNKKYLYVIRPLLAIIWSDMFHTPPPMHIGILMNRMPPSPLRDELTEMVMRKQRGAEQGGFKRNDIIDEWIESVLKKFENGFTGKPGNKDHAMLTGLFIDVMEKAWDIDLGANAIYGV